MKKTILTTVLLLTLGQIGFSQNLDKTKLDNYFNTLEQNNKFMGSVAVSKNGEIIYTKSIGLEDVENNVKSTENSKYRIGSISKSFTTVLILKAVEQKTVNSWKITIQNQMNTYHIILYGDGTAELENQAMSWSDFLNEDLTTPNNHRGWMYED
jgi:hypothetical protein